MHYRDDLAALEARRDDLRLELADITKKAAELRAVERDRQSIERELAAIEARLAKQDARRASLLDDVRVASPCNASWDAMTGDERVRFCGECKKNVYNLSAMAREEAEALLAAREGSLCVRLYRRADGTVLTSDCSVGARKKRVRLALFTAAGAGALAAAAACYTRSPPAPEVIMGAIAAMPPDTYVDMPLDADLVPGIVLVFWREARPGHPREQWTLFDDGRVVHEIDGAPAPVLLPEASVSKGAVDGLLAKAGALRASATGVVSAYADSAAYAGFELYGTGTAEPSDADRRQIVELAQVIAASADPPR